MKKILILGVTGMLGNQIYKNFKISEKFEIFGTTSKKNEELKEYKYLFNDKNIFYETKIINSNIDNYIKIIQELKPDIIINCIGAVKQIKYNNSDMILLNSLFPNKISEIKDKNSLMINISTDCVFKGDKGSYSVEDKPDGIDIYSISKILGEVKDINSITIRTSIYGPELFKGEKSLLGWLISNEKKELKGFCNAFFSGVSTIELSKKILELIENDFFNKKNKKIYHITGDKISKFDLITKMNESFDRKNIISKDYDFKIDRSLKTEYNELKIKKSHKNQIEEIKNEFY